MLPRYPIYIVSKGRAQTRYTSRALDLMRVPYSIVVEPQEFDAYAAAGIDPAQILTLPFSNLGLGSIPARNWIWEHAVTTGATRHWILDDNMRGFICYNHSDRKTLATDGEPFRRIEDFVDGYTNIALAGMQYAHFAVRSGPALPMTIPFLVNTRIYSCILVRNALPHRWRGRYNEDTDLSLRVLKDGWCTLLFYAYLCKKAATMSMRGGNTDVLYRHDAEFDGRLAMAESLHRQHPDIVRVARKYGRWQHIVDYRGFKKNKLVRITTGVRA